MKNNQFKQTLYFNKSKTKHDYDEESFEDDDFLDDPALKKTKGKKILKMKKHFDC